MQIVVHNSGPDGSLRGACAALGKPSVTIEIGGASLALDDLRHRVVAAARASRSTPKSATLPHSIFSSAPALADPQSFHSAYIDAAYAGVLNTLAHLCLGGVPGGVADVPPERQPAVCSRSMWLFTETGGVMVVHPAVAAWVRRGDVVAEIFSIFGALVDRVIAPCDGIVVGKSTNPVAQSGDRVLHLGIVEAVFPRVAQDGHL